MLEKFKNMGKALKEAQNMKGMMEEVQKELEKSIIPISELDGKIKIEITGELQVVKFEIDPSLLTQDQKQAVENAVQQGFSKAIKQAKDLATNKLQSVTGGLFSGGAAPGA
ncbi:nucleoid-associated protein, YbaB/EbfC family [Candidatus Marinamargulisbacteria bacterium SCGC AG-343-K17]|nr:nucleoid-associated protein, YbaB/EbfC family [Candidatus Marinamargulisbacteria bacterium SCGC AG-343-K17]